MPPVFSTNVAMLEGFLPREADELLAIAGSRTYREGEVILSERDPGETLFFVVRGQVRVEKETLHRRQATLTYLGAGECFGELSLIDRGPRSATVRAAGGDAEIRSWERTSLMRFLAGRPETHRRLLENLVKITAGRLRRLDETLVESAYDTVVEVDDRLRVVRWARLAAREELVPIAGGSDDVIGRDLFEVAPSLLGEAVRAGLRDVLSTGEHIVFGLERETPGGMVRHLELTIAPPAGRGGSGAVLGVRDLTEPKMLENRLIQAEKLAMAGRMSAEIGHELRNFLTGALGLSELLLAEEGRGGSARASEHLRSLQRQLERMQRFALGLLDLGLVRSRKQPSDLNGLVHRLVGFVQGQSRFRTIELVQDLAPDLPLLEVDPGQVQQVLLNLLTNAAEAIGTKRRGRVCTSTRCEKQRVSVVVEDDGPGMPEEVRGRVFQHGFTTKAAGHGFGLAVSRRIVENHGGTIEVRSEPGRGARFEFLFPAPAGAGRPAESGSGAD